MSIQAFIRAIESTEAGRAEEARLFSFQALEALEAQHRTSSNAVRAAHDFFENAHPNIALGYNERYGSRCIIFLFKYL